MKHNLVVMVFILIGLGFSADAQLKLKDKLKKAAKSIVEDELGLDKKETKPGNKNQPAGGDNNSTVQGKKLKPADVGSLLDDAIAAFTSGAYSDCRYQVKEALKNVELEIGYQLLASMPGSVVGLNSDENNDQVVSTGIGFVGMVVSREYGESDKRVTATIGNNSSMGASYSVLASQSYASNDENQKSVTVNGYRGTLTFDGQNTYQLGIPFAQSSVFVLNCQGFSGEDEVMTVADNFKISGYEDLLMDDETDTQEDTEALVYLKESKTKYENQDMEGARYSLQQGLVEVDIIIGKKVLEMLPKEMAGLAYTPEQDEHIAEAMGFAGIYINRVYSSDDGQSKVEVTMMDDSPMMAMVSTFLSSPLMAMSGNKSIKIDGYRGMFEAVEGAEEYNINIPNNQSLLTMNFVNVPESDVNVSANQVPVGKIFAFTK